MIKVADNSQVLIPQRAFSGLALWASQKINQNKMRIRKIIVYILQFLSGIGTAYLIPFLFRHHKISTGLTGILMLHFSALIGIAISGYLYLKYFGNIRTFYSAILSSLIWLTVFKLLYFWFLIVTDYNIFDGQQLANTFTIAFAVVGFHTFAPSKVKT